MCQYHVLGFKNKAEGFKFFNLTIVLYDYSLPIYGITLVDIMVFFLFETTIHSIICDKNMVVCCGHVQHTVSLING